VARDPVAPDPMTADPAAARPRPLVVLHGYEDPPGHRRVVGPDDPRWQLLEPRGPIELAGGPAWYATDDDGPVAAQLWAGLDRLHRLVADLGPSSVTIGGFSQGGAMALATALTSPPGAGPAAVFSVNAWLPNLPDRPGRPSAAAYDASALAGAGTRVLVVASADDQVVPVQQGRSAARYLSRAEVEVTYIELAGGHAVGPDARAAVTDWLTG
jgi:predicted esterase